MKSTMKAVMVTVVVGAFGIISGCGGGGSDGSSSGTGPSPAPSAGGATAGAALYAANCAGCHGALATSAKKGATAAQIQVRMAASPYTSRTLTAAEVQAIADALSASTPTPTPTTDGTALYAANCASCHGALATSAKKGATAAQIQVRMAASPYTSRTLTAAEVQAIATALAVTPPTPTPTPTTDGTALYAANCASCHGALATSAKAGATAAQIQVRMAASPYTSRTLTVAEVQAIATALAVTTPTPTPTPSTDGAALYAANCASCHGALATSAKAGATAAQIQVRMAASPYTSRTLTAAEVQSIANALAVSTPTPNPTCGSCHAVPPATGEHSKHKSQNIGCATCHGSGYSATTVNAATHNNGVKNLTTTIGWNAAKRSCSNSCHGSKSW